MDETLHKIRIKRVLPPTNHGTAVLLGTDEKTFVMFIGMYEGAAILRELNDEKPPRPLTHELLAYVMSGFDITVKQIIISEIVNDTFCATLILEQPLRDAEGQETELRKEVRIDARPSDCLVLALKTKKQIWATEKVLDKVRDVSEGIGVMFKPKEPEPEEEESPFSLKNLGIAGIQEELDKIQEEFGKFDADDDDEEDEDEV